MYAGEIVEINDSLTVFSSGSYSLQMTDTATQCVSNSSSLNNRAINSCFFPLTFKFLTANRSLSSDTFNFSNFARVLLLPSSDDVIFVVVEEEEEDKEECG